MIVYELREVIGKTGEALYMPEARVGEAKTWTQVRVLVGEPASLVVKDSSRTAHAVARTVGCDHGRILCTREERFYLICMTQAERAKFAYRYSGESI